MNKVVLYCRPGFEKECAAEITDKAARLEVFGFARVKEDSGYVIFEGYQQDDGEKLVRDLPFSSLIFARQMFVVGELLRDLPPEDRITPIVGMLQGVVEKGWRAACGSGGYQRKQRADEVLPQVHGAVTRGAARGGRADQL